MRKTAVLLLLLAAVACEQRTETQTTTGTNGTVQEKTTTVSSTVPSVDTAEAKRKIDRGSEKLETAARDAAHATGTAMEKAGKTIEQQTSTRKH